MRRLLLGGLRFNAIAAAASFALAACQGTGPDEADTVVVLRTPMATQMAAIVEGVVEGDSSNCLRLGERLILWPPDTVAASDDRITLPDGTIVAPGDRISAGGGEVPDDVVRSLAAGLPEACAYQGGVVIYLPVTVNP